MKTYVIDVARVKCKYEDKCKDYQTKQYMGQSPSRCKRCNNNKYAEKNQRSQRRAILHL